MPRRKKQGSWVTVVKGREKIIAAASGIIPAVWLALLTAPLLDGGLTEIVSGLPDALCSPFAITICEDSMKTVFLFLWAYMIGIGIAISSGRNYRRGEEMGSAVWGDATKLDRKYRAVPDTENKILTQNVRIGLDGRKHRRNLNVLVCGGSGSGKTRFYCKPNLMQANTSLVVLDPKGGAIRSCMKSARAQLNN